MKLIIVKPELHKFESCAEFAEAFKLGENGQYANHGAPKR